MGIQLLKGLGILGKSAAKQTELKAVKRQMEVDRMRQQVVFFAPSQFMASCITCMAQT